MFSFKWFVDYILGQEYCACPDSPEQVFGRFNRTLLNRLLVIFPETSGRDTFIHNDKIKKMIDGNGKIYIEKKGIDAIEIENNMSFIFFTNHDNPIRIEETDRRFVLIQCNNEWVRCSKKKKDEHFKKIIELMDNSQKSIFDEQRSKRLAKIFYILLKRINLTDFSIGDRPETDAYKNEKRSQSSIINEFIRHITEKMIEKKEMGENNWYEYKKKGLEFFTHFSNWKNKAGFDKYEYNITKFCLEIKKHFPFIKKEIDAHKISHYTILYVDAIRYFEEKGYFDEFK